MKVPLLSTPMRYFLAVADAGTVSRAAQHLHVAGSAISRQVSALESALGVALFERRQRGMALTPAGERLAGHLRAVVSDGAQALEQVRGLHAAAGRQVRIACTEGFAAGFLPAVLARLRQAHPQSQVQVAVLGPEAVVEQVLRREADLGLAYRVTTPAGCTVHHDSAVPMVALMQPAHPLARRRTVTVRDVTAFPLLLNARGTTARLLFELACSERGLAFEAAVTGSSLAVLLPLVGEREVLMTGDLTAAHLVAQGTLAAVPFAPGELPARRVQLLSLEGRTLPPLAQACAEAVAAAITDAGPRRKAATVSPAAASRRRSPTARAAPPTPAPASGRSRPRGPG